MTISAAWCRDIVQILGDRRAQEMEEQEQGQLCEEPVTPQPTTLPMFMGNGISPIHPSRAFPKDEKTQDTGPR